MKPLYTILFLLSYPLCSRAQALHIDSTRFITGNNIGTSIAFAIPTADNGILFVGTEWGNPGGILPSFLLDTVDANVFIGKIDDHQHISWLKVYGGNEDDNGISACQTPDGGYAVLATTGSDNGDVTSLTGSLGTDDLWLIRIDAAGNLLWQKCYGATNGGSGAISIASTPDNGFILLGWTNGSDSDVPFHYGPLLSGDWLVLKTDSMGNKQWSKDLGGSGDERLTGSILSVDSFYYLIGASSSTDHDCTDTAWHAGVNTGYDYYMLKLDDTGKVLWDSSYGGSGDEETDYAIFDARDSSIVITGSGMSSDYMETDQHGEGDMLTIKTDKNGVMQWHRSIGWKSWDIGTSIIIGPDNGYILNGYTYPDPDTTMGDIGAQDCWVFALDSAGNELTNKIFGGKNGDISYSILPYLNGYASLGQSASLVFTDGTTYGNFDISAINPDGGGAFISYIGYWPLEVKNANSQTGLSMTVYPNPSVSTIRLLLKNNYNNGSITIMNSIGQMCYSTKINSNITYTDIETKGWTKGVYLVLWQSDNGQVLTEQLVID